MADGSIVAFGEQIIDALIREDGTPVTLGDLRSAFKQPAGVVVWQPAGGASRTIATLPTEPIVPPEAGIELTFVVPEAVDVDAIGDDELAMAADEAIVRDLLAMGAADALRLSAGRHQPYVPPTRLSAAGLCVYGAGAYDPFFPSLFGGEGVAAGAAARQEYRLPREAYDTLTELPPSTRTDPLGLRELLLATVGDRQ